MPVYVVLHLLPKKKHPKNRTPFYANSAFQNLLFKEQNPRHFFQASTDFSEAAKENLKELAKSVAETFGSLV